MSYAVKTWETFALSCPKCETGIPEHNTGSLFYMRHENAPEQVICPGCGAKLTVPKGAQ